jgi:replicative DNA helicase
MIDPTRVMNAEGVVADRVPPQNLDAEMALLGAILADREIMPAVVLLVSPSDFYAHVHEAIFNAMVTLFQRGEVIDCITVCEMLQRRNQLENVGGMSYIMSLLDSVQTVQSAQYLARIIREKAIARGLIRVGPQIMQIGYECEEDVRAGAAQAESLLRAVTERSVRNDVGYDAAAATRRVWDDLQAEKKDGQLTPWRTLNKMIGAFSPGELIIWPGAAKAGKTGLGMCLADFIAATYGPVDYYALEMGEKSIARRFLAMYSGISARRIRFGHLSGSDWDRLGDAMQITIQRPIRYYNRPKSVSDIRALLARSKTPPVAIVIDHIGFLDEIMRSGGRESKNDRLESVYAALLDVAAEFQVVIHGIQHVNREGMVGKPTIRDIRGGGNPEGFAHAVIFPYRPHPTGTREAQREAVLIVGAIRDGEAGEVDMEYVGHRHLWAQRDDPFAWWEARPAEETAQEEFSL